MRFMGSNATAMRWQPGLCPGKLIAGFEGGHFGAGKGKEGIGEGGGAEGRGRDNQGREKGGA